MKKLFGLVALAVWAEAAMADDLTWLEQVSLLDARIEDHDGQLQARYRFVWPNLKSDTSYEIVAPGLMALCNDRIVPELGNQIDELWQIVVSVSEKPIEIGDMDPEVAQVFEAFVVVDGSCSWGEF